MVDIKNISEKLSKEFQDEDKKAKEVLQILVCGCHTTEDIKIMEKFKDRQINRGIKGVFLLRDFKINTEKTDVKELYHKKFRHLWELMKSGSNIPMLILFASNTSNASQGLNSEIQDIATDLEKIGCAYLFKTSEAKLNEYALYYTHSKDVKDGEEFIIQAEKVIDAKINVIKMYYYKMGLKK